MGKKVGEGMDLSGMSKPVKSVSVKDETRYDELLMGPGKFEMTEEDNFKVKFRVGNVEGRWVISSDLDDELHWVEFRMWTFDEEIELRNRATHFNERRRLHFVDNDELNRMKVQKLLKGWSFSKDNERLKLHHVNGVLTDESWKAFTKVHTNIVRFILERMNAILEHNG